MKNIIVLLLLIPIHSFAYDFRDADIERFRLLFATVDELRDLHLKDTLTIEEYQNALELACNVLTETANDDTFLSMIKFYAEEQHTDEARQAVKQLVTDFQLFVRFVMIERDILMRAGLSEPSIDYILGLMFDVRQQVANFVIDYDMTTSDLHKITEEICAAKELVSQQSRRDHMMYSLAKSTMAVSGLAIIAADGILSPASVISAVSVLFGGAMVFYAEQW